MSDRLFGDDVIFQQRFLKSAQLYTGRIDGIAGDGTKAAFARMGTWLYWTRC